MRGMNMSRVLGNIFSKKVVAVLGILVLGTSGLFSIAPTAFAAIGAILQPNPVSQFVITMTTPVSADLSWMTPAGADLSEVDLRYSTSPITDATMQTATRVAGIPLPIPSTAQGVSMGGLQPNTLYYFAIRTVNVLGVVSTLVTNSATTPALGGGGGTPIPPDSVSNFSVLSQTQTSMTVGWTAPQGGDLSEYDLRYSVLAITDANFNTATKVSSLPLPVANTHQETTIENLSAGTAYYLAIKVINVVGTASLLSTTSGTTQSSNNGGGGGGGVVIPVSPVTNFIATSSAGTTFVTLSWKTPQDGGLSEFRIRYTTSTMTEGNFTSGILIPSVPLPIPNTTQSVIVNTLAFSNTYSFGIKTVNTVGQESVLVTTSITTPTANPFSVPAVTDMSVTGVDTTCVNVRWKTPQDGSLSQFQLRYSTSLLNDATFGTATPISTVALPMPGTVQNTRVCG
jgi:hypothetical protein